MLSTTKPVKLLHSASLHVGVSRRAGCSGGRYIEPNQYSVCSEESEMPLAAVDKNFSRSDSPCVE
jgi:hypothetical protein